MHPVSGTTTTMYMYILDNIRRSVAWQPNFDKQMSSHEKGGGIRGVEQ